MSGVNPNAVLFGDGSDGDDVADFSAVLDAAEAAYEADIDAGGTGENVDLTAPLAEAADLDSDADDEGESDEDDADDTADEDDDDSDEDDSDDDDEAEWTAKFRDQRASEEAYENLRAEHNRLLWEAQQLQLQQQQALQQQLEAARQPAQAPVSANDDPIAAFRAAVESDDAQTAEHILATVSLHATQFAAQAAQLRAEGEDEAAALYDNRAMNATSFAERMRYERVQHEYQQRIQEEVTPLQERDFRNTMNVAATRAMNHPIIASAYEEGHADAIGQYVQAYPQIMGDWSPEAMEHGFQYAAKQVIFGGEENMIQYLVEQKVAELAAQNPPKRPGRGTAGGAGRRQPSATPTTEESEADAIRASVSGQIPNGMNILFGG